MATAIKLVIAGYDAISAAIRTAVELVGQYTVLACRINHA